MIYTVGHTKNYHKAIAQARKNGETIWKCKDGIAFLTQDEAQRYINERGLMHRWSVFAIDASWRDDTRETEGYWRLLNRDADLYKLEELDR